jgi:rRNA-processing protein FCF1
MTILLIIFVIALVLYFASGVRNKEAEKNIQKRKIKPYVKQMVLIELVGVKYRIEAKKGLEINSELILKYEVDNEYDKNAIAVFRKDTDILIGYLPRNQRKIILTLKENPNYLAILRTKNWRYAGGDPHGNRWGEVELYLGYTLEELNVIREQHFPY